MVFDFYSGKSYSLFDIYSGKMISRLGSIGQGRDEIPLGVFRNLSSGYFILSETNRWTVKNNRTRIEIKFANITCLIIVNIKYPELRFLKSQ